MGNLIKHKSQDISIEVPQSTPTLTNTKISTLVQRHKTKRHLKSQPKSTKLKIKHLFEVFKLFYIILKLQEIDTL